MVFLTRLRSFKNLRNSFVLQTKLSRKNCGFSFLSSVLQVQNLWRYSHVLPIAVLYYVSFCRCMFVYSDLNDLMYSQSADIFIYVCSVGFMQKGPSNYKSHYALRKCLEMMNCLELHSYFILFFICGQYGGHRNRLN